MSDTKRPGELYWIDHYVVGSDDLQRWAEFHAKVLGAEALPRDRQGNPRFLYFQKITAFCHHGAMLSPDPLPPSQGLGKGLPRQGLFIRQEDVASHVQRLDKLGVPHLPPTRTSVGADDGTSIVWQDPDGNQFEFWAPDHLPDGAMAGAGPLGVGRISHVVCESQDLQRAADHFATYCATEPSQSDISGDTLVLRTLGGARIIYKKVDKFSQRTGGWGKLHASHAALAMRDEDFWPSYEKMWAGVGEWEWDPNTHQFIGAGQELPARTSRHGSPAGQKWFEIRHRGDDWYDWDTNCFHFVGLQPLNRACTEYEAHTMEWQLPKYMREHNLVTAS